jgi:threonine dehydrogenase-like Zn-dependent dehydrogenase
VIGALSERISVPVRLLHPTPGLEGELAALVEPVSIGVHSVRRSGARPGDTVLVLGGGPIGLATTLAAADLGCRVIVADRVPSRLERAILAGASAVINSTTDDLPGVIGTLTDDEGPGVVIDATGSATLIRTAVEVVAHAGVVVVVGISSDELSIPVALLSRKELSLMGSRNSVGDFDEAIRLVRRHAQTVRSWITHRVGLDELPDAIAFAREHPELVEKMIVQITPALTL